MRKLISLTHFRSIEPGLSISDRENESELELAIASASDRIERHLHRRFIAAKHKVTVDFQDEDEVYFPIPGTNRVEVEAGQWPIIKMLSVRDAATGDKITDMNVEIYDSDNEDPERIRYFAIGPENPRPVLIIEYAGGYRLFDEMDDQVNERLGTDSIEWPVIPASLSQAVIDIITTPRHGHKNILESLDEYRK